MCNTALRTGALTEADLSTPPQRAGLTPRSRLLPPLLSSPLLNADVLLTSAYNSAKMFNSGSKLLLLFLLAFPCGLMSIGKCASFLRWMETVRLHFGNSCKL